MPTQEMTAVVASNAPKVVATQPGSIIEAIVQAARDPQVDAAKMQALWHLKESIDAQQAQQAFVRAFVECRAAIRPIVRDAWNSQTQSKYAKLETIDRSIIPVLSRHGFAFTFSSPDSNDKTVTISCKLLHSAGHSEPYQLTGPADVAGIQGKINKTPMHALGSTTTYLRRYLKLMAFDLTLENEDDDANANTEALSEQQRNHIYDLLIECAMEGELAKPFLAFMGAASVETIPAHDYIKAVNSLQARKRANQKKEAAPKQPVQVHR